MSLDIWSQPADSAAVHAMATAAMRTMLRPVPWRTRGGYEIASGATSYDAGMTRVEIECTPLGPFETNCYVLRDADDPARHCWIVDPGAGPGPVIDAVRRAGLVPQAVLLTHAHADHVAGVEEVRAAFPGVPVLLHRAEHAFLGDPQLNLSAFVGLPVSVGAADGALEPGAVLALGGTRWRVLHTPGHSPGSVTLVCDAAGEAIVGDTLFAGSIGRVDFPTSDPAAMHRSLHEVLMALPDAVRVHPGHGPSTTVGRERASNPWLQDDGWADAG
jgi:glyoxylase-like metal-dependent hydrolase (beta-lactamase superfamily II)